MGGMEVEVVRLLLCESATAGKVEQGHVLLS